MNNALKFCLTVLSVFSYQVLQAQELMNQPPEMADAMRANGKIYVVVAVLVTIVAGLLFYLVKLDRKLTKLEQE